MTYEWLGVDDGWISYDREVLFIQVIGHSIKRVKLIVGCGWRI